MFVSKSAYSVVVSVSFSYNWQVMEARPLKDLPIGSNFIVDFNWESNIPSRTIRDTVTISFVEENENPKEEDIT